MGFKALDKDKARKDHDKLIEALYGKSDDAALGPHKSGDVVSYGNERGITRTGCYLAPL